MNTFKWATIASSLLLTAPALSQSPYLQPDDTWIQISGTVQSVSADSFVLDYGDGTVTVEMDDGDRDADAYKLLPDDNVTVSGLIDDDFFETTTIEASSVYVESIGTYFYASSIDEEERVYTFTVPLVISETTLRGTVAEVDAMAGEFQLNTGQRMVTVEVDEMAYNPIDDEGYQQVGLNDVVSVTGHIDTDLFEGRVFEADYVTTLIDN
ncbi:hypothetical protein [Pseudidiomarina terrestris]|uniref:DUF5666 domain-containing protein n=1 Tax=Pseudidiomarina terrestris TaxID=2820060 RepID=A0AAW7QVS7_9GAMM|nr:MULTISPECIES: hypothetical protein [unclassified Pseudidiomarina]MDN7123516.1 hypothetical protein [Pseudidiomarina sp. 1APP75-32.1]MDN7126694.1 hypothetical protein [Pseudidiomarina sp. 1APR75-33.1]MDN7134981.1 hypothetical protein [Pseudidiomarina sp. 1ASP75-5]MDN7137652.1 hypothetical protein [Pseudidiomarina sp. 1ASP75-14]MEA3587240.1 hypothetical protein [Pseudidiomarina sp. 1APP75-27a]